MPLLIQVCQLPPKKVGFDRRLFMGVHEKGVFAASDTVWFVAETVGDNSKVAWVVARLNGIRTEA